MSCRYWDGGDMVRVGLGRFLWWCEEASLGEEEALGGYPSKLFWVWEDLILWEPIGAIDLDVEAGEEGVWYL